MRIQSLRTAALALLVMATSVAGQDLGRGASETRPRRVGAEPRAVDLLGLAIADRVDEMAQLLDSGVGPDARDANGDTALIFAASNSSDDAVDLLLARGADVNRINKHHQSALMLAAWTGDTRAVRTLLEHGADVKATDALDCTALHYAANGMDPSI